MADQSVFWTSMDTIIIVGAVLAGVFWLLQIYAFVRRRQETPMHMRSVVMALVSGGGAAAVMSFAVLTCVSAYWFFFFKLSDKVHSMLPNDGEIGLVRNMLYAAVTLQSLDVAMEIYRLVNMDVFVIDWEKPRRVMLPGGSGEDEAPVSVWRALFIANQWGDYQARRLTNPTLTILFMVFFLGGIHLDRIGYVMPDTSREYHEFLESSLLLRMGLTSLLMLALFAAQGTFMVWVYHRYVKNPMEDFVDLCFLAKVSVVILSEDFAGYYLHGRNRMPFAQQKSRSRRRKPPDAVDLTSKVCQHADCKKQASFGPPDGPRLWCAEHQAPGAVNLKRKRKLGVEAAPGRAQKKGKKAAAKPKKRAAPAATQERAPKRKASSARATAPAKAAKAPKVGRGGAKKKAATKQLSALVAVAGAVNRAGNGKSDGAAATRRSSRRGSA